MDLRVGAALCLCLALAGCNDTKNATQASGADTPTSTTTSAPAQVTSPAPASSVQQPSGGDVEVAYGHLCAHGGGNFIGEGSATRFQGSKSTVTAQALIRDALQPSILQRVEPEATAADVQTILDANLFKIFQDKQGVPEVFVGGTTKAAVPITKDTELPTSGDGSGIDFYLPCGH